MDAEIGDQLFERGCPREAREDGIKLMQRVADLVNRTRFALAQAARFVERLCFKEETNLIARREKVFVARARLLVRREDRDDARIETFNQLFRARTQRRAVRRVDEIFKQE